MTSQEHVRHDLSQSLQTPSACRTRSIQSPTQPGVAPGAPARSSLRKFHFFRRISFPPGCCHTPSRVQTSPQRVGVLLLITSCQRNVLHELSIGWLHCGSGLVVHGSGTPKISVRKVLQLLSGNGSESSVRWLRSSWSPGLSCRRMPFCIPPSMVQSDHCCRLITASDLNQDHPAIAPWMRLWNWLRSERCHSAEFNIQMLLHKASLNTVTAMTSMAAPPVSTVWMADFRTTIPL